MIRLSAFEYERQHALQEMFGETFAREDFIKGKTSDPVRQGGFLEGVMGGTPGQSQIGMIEDIHALL